MKQMKEKKVEKGGCNKMDVIDDDNDYNNKRKKEMKEKNVENGRCIN